ncbi:MAG: ABC transporter ATP-binding protein [Rickettsiaceae bacterium]
MIISKQTYKLPEYFWSFYKPYKWHVFILLLFAIVLGFNGFINSYLTKIIIDSLANLDNQNKILDAIFWPTIFIFLHMEVYSISWRVSDYIRLKTTHVIRNNIVDHAFNYIHNQSQSFFQNSLSGSIANNINILADNIDLISKTIFIRVTRGIVQVLVAFISMYFVHPIFSVALIIWAFTFIFISLKFSRKILALSDEYAKSQSEVSGRMVDSITNFTNVKIFARKSFESFNLLKSLDTMKKRYENREWFLIKFHYLQGLSITILMGFMLYVLIQLRINGNVTIGDFAFILGLTVYVTEYVWTLTEYVDQINDSAGKCRQALKAIFTPIKVNDKEGAKDLIVSSGKIVFYKVHFQYKDTDPLFQNKSITIKPKQKIGLVGYSGGGKSTFVSLLLRLHDIDSGKILIDGQDIQEITQDSLHESIAVIPQDPFLFHRTLKENIRYGKIDATNDEVMQAAKKANIHEFITGLPHGYDSLVGERGVKLSGGQRQRVALARVILKDAPILILDEATSQLDSITENVIKNALDEFMQDKTTIVIAHRLSTLLKMDRILVFDKGKIIEDGTHRELLKAKKLYSKLWNAQTEDFLIDETE